MPSRTISILSPFFILILTGCSLVTGNRDNQDFHQWTKTPPIGWNSWDCYGASVTGEEVRANIDYMAEHLKDYG